MTRISRPSRLALCAAAAPAAAQSLTYTVSPAYVEGVTGNNGWFNSGIPGGQNGAVTVTYTCLPGTLLIQSCPASPERFTHYAGTLPNSGPRPPARVLAPIVRSAVFVSPPVIPITPPPVTVNVTLRVNPLDPASAPLKVDTWGPGAPTVTRPAAGAIYDAGSLVTAAYSCFFDDETSGRWPVNPCAGPVANSANIDTGAADTPATYGARAFVVTAKDLAGNVSTRTVNYTVDELPGKPALTAPAAGATVDARPTFTWTPPADDGSGLKRYRLTVTPASGSARTFDVTSTTNPVVFQPIDDLPAGAARWSVTFVDQRDRTSVTENRTVTFKVNVPEAPKLVNPVARTANPQPSFSWTPAEPGGTFTWEIAAAGSGAVLQGPTTTPGTTMTAAALSPGSYTFRVRQVSAIGRLGAWSAVASFVIDQVPVSTVPQPPVAPPPPSPTPARPKAPPVQNPGRLKPRAGAGVKGVPTLRWIRSPRATLYNVQLFRVSGTKYVKVLTAFPRGTSLKLPAKKLVKGRRYVWRVWPYRGSVRKYTPKPLGVSWFAVKK